jgi:hypothetical protein
MRKLCALLCLVLWSAACGGGGGGTPTAPSPTTTSIAVTLQEILLVGRTATASATATLSNGQTQALGTGWQSNAPAIATVTDGGIVRGIGNGHASISVSSGGQQGSRSIRVAPDYEGSWSGLQTITSCVDSEDFAGICDDPEPIVGYAFPIDLTATQPGNLGVAGEFSIDDIDFPNFNTEIAEDGAITFSSTTVYDVITIAAEWKINSMENGRATGTILEVYSAPEFVDGEIRVQSSLTNFRKGGVAAPAGLGGKASIAGKLRRALAARRR